MKKRKQDHSERLQESLEFREWVEELFCGGGGLREAVHHDGMMEETENLFIETENKPPKKLFYRKSGIQKNKDMKLYCIGNYNVVYIFDIKTLLQCKDSEEFDHKQVKHPNGSCSRGFLIPLEMAEELAIKIQP